MPMLLVLAQNKLNVLYEIVFYLFRGNLFIV